MKGKLPCWRATERVGLSTVQRCAVPRCVLVGLGVVGQMYELHGGTGVKGKAFMPPMRFCAPQGINAVYIGCTGLISCMGRKMPCLPMAGTGYLSVAASSCFFFSATYSSSCISVLPHRGQDRNLKNSRSLKINSSTRPVGQ